jgi:hypothetical protein
MCTVRGFKPRRGDGFLRAIKFRSTTSFGGEVQPQDPCREILRRVKDPLRYDRQNSEAIYRPVFLASLLGVCCNQS